MFYSGITNCKKCKTYHYLFTTCFRGRIVRIAPHKQPWRVSSKRFDTISDYARHGYCLKVDCRDCGHAGKLDARMLTDLGVSILEARELAGVR